MANIEKFRKSVRGVWPVLFFSAVGLAAYVAFVIVLQHFGQLPTLIGDNLV